MSFYYFSCELARSQARALILATAVNWPHDLEHFRLQNHALAEAGRGLSGCFVFGKQAWPRGIWLLDFGDLFRVPTAEDSIRSQGMSGAGHGTILPEITPYMWFRITGSGKWEFSSSIHGNEMPLSRLTWRLVFRVRRTFVALAKKISKSGEPAQICCLLAM